MPISDQKQPVFRFSVFELDAASGVLRKHGVKLKLQDQPCHVLTLLLERPGETITREEIKNRLWPDNTNVDFDNAINSAIRKLRDVLGDEPENPRFVETLARRGYRFIAPVARETGRPAAMDALPAEPQQKSLPVPGAAANRRSHRFWASGSLALVFIAAALGGWWWWVAATSKHVANNEPLPAVPLTGNLGYEMFPVISPEGTRVAYAWEQPGKQFPDIYIKLIGQGDPTRLTTTAAGAFAPAWSPDGRWIAYLRVTQPIRAAITIVPSLGGQEREVAEISLNVTNAIGHPKAYIVPPPYLAWSSDGRWLFSVQDPGSILRVAVSSGAKQALTLRATETKADGGIAVSPDGKTLAFTRVLSFAEEDIYLLPLSEDMLPAGRPRRLTFDNKEINGLAWTADGSSLVFSSTRGGRLELWRVAVSPGGKPFRITAAGDDPSNVAVAREGHSLVYSHQIVDWDIWRMPLSADEKQQAYPLITSTRRDLLPKYSPDGQRIAFESDRSGADEIWVSQSDGSHAVPLTSLGAWSGSPRWSADGKQIAFDSNVAGNWGIYVISSQGGQPTRLTNSNASAYRASWSHDGRWIYYCSTSTGQEEIWKIPAGGGPEVPITKHGGCLAFESADGNDLYYIKGAGLWKMPVRGGDETLVLPAILGANYVLSRHGIYFLEGDAAPGAAKRLRFLDFTTHKTNTIRMVSGFAWDEIAVSPDERSVLLHKVVRDDSELMVIANFQ